MKKLLATFIIFSQVLIGCSTQYREAEQQLSQEELDELIAEFQEYANYDENLQTFTANEGSSNSIYHAGSAPGRPAASVISVSDLSLFNEEMDAITSRQAGLNSADAVFIDTTDENGARTFILMLKWTQAGDEVPFYFVGSNSEEDAVFTDDEFSVTIEGDSGYTFVLKSRDLSEQYANELGDAVKLDIYLLEGNKESYVGQVSTMAGY